MERCILKFRRQVIVYLKRWFYFDNNIGIKSSILNKFEYRKLF